MSKYYYNSRLKGKHKVFDEDLYEKYDIPARETLKKRLGDFVADHPNKKKFPNQKIIIVDVEGYKYYRHDISLKLK